MGCDVLAWFSFVIKLTNTIHIEIKRLRQTQATNKVGKDSLKIRKDKVQKIIIYPTLKKSSVSIIPIPNLTVLTVFIVAIYSIYNFIGSYTNE